MAEPADLSTPLAWACKYAEAGWHVLPLEPKGKAPLGKLVPRGMLDATTDLAQIRAWWATSPHANVGIALAPSGLVAIDVDPRNGGTETFEQLQAEHGSLRSDVMAFTGGGGEHHVFVVPPGVHVSLPGTLGPGIDLKANGYIVVEPSLHPSGKQYGWEASSNPLDGVVPSTLPDWLRSLRVRLDSPKPSAADKPMDARQAQHAREALYLLDADDYHQWVQAGMALHSTGWGQAAYAMWCTWAQQSDKFDPTDSRKKWLSFTAPDERGNGLSLAWIFAEAQRRGWVNPAARLKEAPRTHEEPPPYLDEAPMPEGFDIEPEAKPADLLPLLTMGELIEKAAAVRWLVKKVVPAESVGILFGGSGSFKSFIALDMALHIVHGLPWLGKKTKQAPVVFIAAEGGSGIAMRIQAWHREHGLTWEDKDLRVIPVAVDLAEDCARVVETVQASGLKPGLVVVDTMSQTFSGEENSAKEVAAYLRELGLWLRDAWSCSVLVIHHTGHLATERPRGSSAIRSNVDYMLGCFREEKEMLATVSCVKQKDAELFKDQTFALSVFELGTDEDGEPETALVARAVMSDEEKQQLVAHEASTGRSGRNAMLLQIAQNGMPEQELRKAFYEDCGLADAEARRQAYYRALNWAKKAGLVEIAQGYVLLLKGSNRDN